MTAIYVAMIVLAGAGFFCLPFLGSVLNMRTVKLATPLPISYERTR